MNEDECIGEHQARLNRNADRYSELELIYQAKLRMQSAIKKEIDDRKLWLKILDDDVNRALVEMKELNK